MKVHQRSRTRDATTAIFRKDSAGYKIVTKMVAWETEEAVAPDADGRRQAWPMHRERFVGKRLPTDASPTQPGGSAVVSAVYCTWE